MKTLRDLFRLHGVKVIMLLLTIGFFTYDMSQGTRHSSYFMALLILFQIRGIMWENNYHKQAIRLQEEIDTLKATTVHFAVKGFENDTHTD